MIPVNHILLSLDKAFQDEIITDSGIKFYVDTRFNSEWHTTVVGEVAALPVNPKKHDEKIIGQLKYGDQVAFSYDVVADRTYGSSAQVFTAATEGSQFYKEWVNGNRDMLKKVAMPGAIAPIWVGVLTDKRGELIDGAQGSESEVDRWLSQFSFDAVQECRFNNIVEVEGKDYWKVYAEDIFAVKRGDEIQSVSNRVICAPIIYDLTDRINLSEGIQLPPMSVSTRLLDRAMLISGGEDKGLKKGDIVSFNPEIVEKYVLWGKEYFLIQEQFVNGVWN